MFFSCKTFYFGVLHSSGQPKHWPSIVFCYSGFVQNDTPKTFHLQVLVSIEQQTSQWIHSKQNFSVVLLNPSLFPYIYVYLSQDISRIEGRYWFQDLHVSQNGLRRNGWRHILSTSYILGLRSTLICQKYANSLFSKNIFHWNQEQLKSFTLNETSKH